MALGFARAGKSSASPAALRDSAPTQERAPERVARGTKPQPRQEGDDFESEVATIALDNARDVPTRAIEPRRVASNGGVLEPRHVASNGGAIDVPRRAIEPRHAASNGGAIDVPTRAIEPHRTASNGGAIDVPTRAIEPRRTASNGGVIEPRRAASNGGVMAPEAFDSTRALSPRAAIQLAHRTASRESLASTEQFEREVSTISILDDDDVSIIEEPSIAPHERARPLATAKGIEEPSIAPHERARPLATAKGVEELGPYLLHERIGSGGMGSVHRAELRGIAGFRKSIAVKRMWPHLATDAHLVKAFIQEARLASVLRHHNIVQAYDFGKLDGSYFIAMELVEGPTLSAAIKQANRAAGAIPLAVTIDILIQLCEALEYAHGLADETGRSLGIVHRDVSPANMILSEGGIVKLIDFGVAKAERSQIHTEAGVIKGKLAYVAPEYTNGQLDARADLWGVGVIAYELLTGQRLFIGEHDFETLRNVREKPIYAPSRVNPQIGRDLDDIVLTALERDPDRRWQSAGALRNALCGVARDLRLVLGGQAIREWCAWAFAQEPRRDTKIVRVLHTLDAGTPSPAQQRVEQMRDARSRRNAEQPIAAAPAVVASARGVGPAASLREGVASARGVGPAASPRDGAASGRGVGHAASPRADAAAARAAASPRADAAAARGVGPAASPRADASARGVGPAASPRADASARGVGPAASPRADASARGVGHAASQGFAAGAASARVDGAASRIAAGAASADDPPPPLLPPTPVTTPRRDVNAAPFARSRVLEQRAPSSGAAWWLLLLATIAGFIALAISQGWISEDTLVHLADRVDRLRNAF